MNPVDKLTERIETIDIAAPPKTAVALFAPRKDDEVNVRCALELATSLKSLHEQNRAHRTICNDAVSTVDNVSFFLGKSDEEACDSDVEKLFEIVGATFASMPPERMQPQYTGSWLPDDVYALGCVFYEAAFARQVPWAGLEGINGDKKKESLAVDSTHAKNLLQTPQLLKDLLPLLSLWMLHPDPKERPTIATVCEKLYNIFPHHLPTLSPMAYDYEGFKQITLDPSAPEGCAKLALEILGQNCPAQGYAYLPRTEIAGSHFQIIGSLEKNWVLLLPSKSKYDEKGTFKVGRRGAIVLEKVDEVWKAKEYYALSSRNESCPAAFKAAWAKEMWLYEQLGNKELFAKHYISFTYPKKPHKRLSLYEAFPQCLFEERSHAFTLQRAHELALKIEYLHKLGLANRDLKSENVLVAKDSSLILCDPDSVVQDEMWKSICDRVGTEITQAPERYTTYTGSFFPDDIYMLGCLFYEKFHDKPLPWVDEDSTSKEIYQKKLSLKTEASNAAGLLNSELFEATIPLPQNRAIILMYWMLHPDPKQRPTIERVCEELKKLTPETTKAE